jgi:phosphate transport system substrate-binding protein
MKTLLAVAASLAPHFACALDVVPPPYQARAEIAGVIRVWGSTEMKPLLTRWEAGFRRLHPQVRFVTNLTGSDIGMAALYSANADIALLGRDATASEVKAFEWIYRYKPARVAIANGGINAGRSPALVACVHRDNPVAGLTLAQLDALFSAERLRGAAIELRTWGDLGLTGAWAGQPIHLYTFDTESGSGRFFREIVLKGARKLNWDRLTEFRDTSPLPPRSHDAAKKMLGLLAHDRYGLAVAAGPTADRVKRVPIAASANGPPVSPTAGSLVSGSYPLGRSVFAYFNRRPTTPLDAPVAAFLRYALSAPGQQLVTADYLALSPEMAAQQAKELD